ncbi:MAG: AzlD domain-containing protein [Caldilineaceae bacterium]|nr:AzlD domain-containing protein [Caldilineaceae bacterium]
MFALWATLIGIGVVTFAYRFSLIFGWSYITLPRGLNRALRFVPVAALTAIIVPEVLAYQSAIAFTWQNERLLAGLVAVVIAWRTHNALLTIGVGMGCLYALQWLGL